MFLSSSSSAKTNEEILIDEKFLLNIKEEMKNSNFLDQKISIYSEILNKLKIHYTNEEYIEIVKEMLKILYTKKSIQENIPLLLPAIQCDSSFTLEDCISILSSFQSCSVCVKLSELYNASQKACEVDLDYEYEISQKDKQIEVLQNDIEKLKELKIPAKMPEHLESDIYKATSNNDIESLRYYCEIEKIDPNSLSNYLDRTPLHIAAEKGYLPIVEYLIDAQHVSINKPNMKGYSAAHLACINNNITILSFLIEKGSDIEQLDSEGNTCLMLACREGNMDIVKYLIEKRSVKVDVHNNNGFTALHFACWNKSVQLVQYLIRNGFKQFINYHQLGSNAPIHEAAFYSSPAVVQCLLENGANIDEKGTMKQTPLMCATIQKNRSVITFLLDAGANKMLTNSVGKTAFDMTNMQDLKLILSPF